METRKIIRGEKSGVFFGEVERREGREVVLKNVRRLWYWDGAASLSELALSGVKLPRNCKFTVTVSAITVLDAIEILDVTDAAAKSIDEVAIWTA